MVQVNTGVSVHPKTVLIALASLSLFCFGGYLGTERVGGTSVSAILPANDVRGPGAEDFSGLGPAPEWSPDQNGLDRVRLELATELAGRALALPSGYPVPCPLTSRWGMRMHPKRKKRLPHHGVDLGCPVGTAVLATADGSVLSAGKDGRSGRWLRVTHDGGYGTVFAHLDTVLVRAGQAVALGDTLALSGETGDVTGPHLHYELNWGGRRSDSLSVPTNALAALRHSLLVEAEQLIRHAPSTNSPGEAPNR